MKILLLVLLIPGAALAQSQRFYGPNGQSLGTATTIDRTTTFYGPNGAKTGSASTVGGTTTFYGANGQVQGHSYGRTK